MVTLTTKAMNHDPRHLPYGICWLESNKAIDQGSLRKVLAESATEGCATRWPRRNRWTSGQATGSARCSIAGDTNTASSSGYSTKQPLEAPPIYAAAAVGATEHSHDHSTPEMASQNLPADTKMIDSMEETAAAAAVAATEHSKDDSTPEKASQNLPADTKKSDSMEEPAACQS